MKKWREKYYSGVSHDPRWQSLGGKRSRDYLPGRTTLNAQSTRHGARPGPTLAPRCTRAPAYPAAEGARNDPRPAEQGMQMCKNSAFGTYAICRVSRWRGILFSTSVWWRNPLLHFCMAGLGLLCCRARGQTNTAATGRAVDWFIGLHGYLYCRCYLGGEVSQLLIADNPSHKCVSQIFA